MTFAEAIAYLDTLAQFGLKLDLDRIQRLCQLCGHPERRLCSVLVGGSAGKGSTAGLLDSILRAAGIRTGFSPKPHLQTQRERTQVDGALIPEARFAELMSRLQPLADAVAAEGDSPTVFEVLTLLSLLYFVDAGVGCAVIEVGLGGRFDATNVLPADLSIITMIGLDHTDRLGETLPQIAFEKAGIIKQRARLVTGAQGDALAVIERAAHERESRIQRLGREIEIAHVQVKTTGTTFDLTLPEAIFTGLETPLLGAHQARNAALAIAAAWWLRDLHPTIDESCLREGLNRASMPARLQVVRERPLVIVDAAHSPDRADALDLTLQTLYLAGHPARRYILVLGCTAGHSPREVVGRLAQRADTVIATRSRHPQAVPAEDVAAAARENGTEVEVIEPVSAAYEAALTSAHPDDLVVISGSLFTAAEALAHIQSKNLA